MARAVPDDTVRALVLTPGDVESILTAIEALGQYLMSAQERDVLPLTTLAAAWRDAAQRLGGDPAA